MSDELLHHGHNLARPLREEEKSLLRALLAEREDFQSLDEQISDGFVVDLPDGGMGSLEFVGDDKRSLGEIMAKAECVDGDGVLVSIVVNADQFGRLFELDMWKVDFSALQQYPGADALHLTS